MDILFLGTSSGVPTKTRNVTGIALREDVGTSWHLIDCGEGTQHQLLHTKLSLHQLRTIFITHIHGDHCYGLPGLLASAGMNGRTESLFIVAPKGIAEWISATLSHTQLHLPYELIFVATESLCDFRAGHFMVTAAELSHRVPSYGYSFTEVRVDSRLNVNKLDADSIPRGPLWREIKKGVDVEYEGRTLRSSDYLLFDNKPRRIVIGGDNDRPELLADACRDCDVLVHEATYTAEIAKKSGESFGHSSAEQVASFAKLMGIPNLVLTHFSARYQADPAKSPSIEDIRKEAAATYHGNLFLAKDFVKYTLQKSGDLHPITD